MHNGLLILSDGSYFYGKSVGAVGHAVGELVFNTSTMGYQEILTDPSYLNQIITFTSSHIGNTGINEDDMESSRIWANGIVMGEMSDHFSHWHGKQTLRCFLEQQKIVALTEIDTRHITYLIRKNGNLTACLMGGSTDLNYASHQLKIFDKHRPEVCLQNRTHPAKTEIQKKRFRLIIIDCGIKKSIIEQLQKFDCDLSFVTTTFSFAKIMSLRPDGVLLSNGPGDPASYKELITLTQKILAAKIPLFAICLGHQILALASGAHVYKMKFGQHGANRPVYDVLQKKVLISSQNHNYAVSIKNLPKHLQVTHVSLIDGSIAGLVCTQAPAFSFQGHPEAGPGPTDCLYLFTQFFKLIEQCNAKAN